jgi:ATP-dependent DNA ligase
MAQERPPVADAVVAELEALGAPRERGFDEALLVSLRALLDGLRRPTPACAGPLPSGGEHVFVEPQLVVEVRYLTWTAEGLLRQPVFLRLRDDKPLEECVVPADRAREREQA